MSELTMENVIRLEVQEYCEINDIPLTKKQIESVVDQLINNDGVWQTYNEAMSDFIDEELE